MACRKAKLNSSTTSAFGGVGGDDTLSVISETPSVFAGKVTHAEKTLTQMGGNRAKDLENTKRALQEKEEEFKELKTKYTACLARTKTLEKQVSEIKG